MKFILMCTCFITMLFFTGCGTTVELPEGTVSYAINAEPASLDPAMTTGLPESNAELALFEGLTRIDENGIPQPALAESWEISEDGLQYIFHLREGICWSDGTPIIADDFVYSWQRVLAPDTASSNAYMLYVIKNAESFNNDEITAEEVGIKALDDKTLQVNLGEPAAYFLSLTAFHAFYPVPKHIIEKNPEGWASSDKDFVSNGPFMLTRWIHSGEIIMIKNDKYWNAASVKLPCITMPISDSPATRMNFFASGNADIISEPPAAEQKKLEEKNLFSSFPMLGTQYYVFNIEKAPFDNKELRKAIALAFEREELVKNVIKAGKKPAYNFIPPGMIIEGNDFCLEAGNLMYEDAAEARKVLANSGYKGEEIDILYATSASSKALCEAVQEMLRKNLGLETELYNQETKVFYANRDNGDFQLALANWVADFSDPINYLDIYYDKNNESRYHDEKFLEIVAKAKQETNPLKRAEYMHAAEKMLIDDYIIIPVYYASFPMVINPAVRDCIISPMGLVDFVHAYKEVGK